MSTLTRRTFLTAGGATVVYLAGCRAVQGSDRAAPSKGRVSLGPWIAITEENTVVVLVDKCEMGQGVRHMFASIVAEELDLTPETVTVDEAPVDARRFHNRHILPKIYGIPLTSVFKFQMTGRSSSTRDMCDRDKLWHTAAGTRRFLMAEAAKRLDRCPGEIDLEAGWAVVRGHPSCRASFADLVRGGAAAAPTPSTKPSLSVLGNAAASRRRIDARAKVTGDAVFGIDLQAKHLRGGGPLLVALVRRPGRVRDSIAVLNADAIRKMPGVDCVVTLEGGRGVAVVADSFWHADRARRAMQSWEIARGGVHADSEAILAGYRKTVETEAAKVPAAGPHSTDWRTYVTPFGPHAAMEPLSAACVREGDDYHIYAASQFPQSARAQAAKVLGVSADHVQVHGLLAGGAFGRRAASDFIVEAAEICRAISGRAVKLMWTREDDFRHDYLRPCAVSRVRASAGPDGLIASWQHLLISESPTFGMDDEFFAALRLGPLLRRAGMKVRQPERTSFDFTDITLEEGLSDSVYELGRGAHLAHVPKVEPPIVETVRLGYWRSVGCFHTIFAVESALDELAWATDSDPLKIRLRNLQRPGLSRTRTQRQERMRWCVERVAAWAGAANLQTRGSGYGIACFSGWDSFAALAVKVTVDDTPPRAIRVTEAWAVVDCGFVLNPDVLHQQVEGGIIFGLSAALKQEITTVNGVISQTNFHACDSLRIHECPTIHVCHREHDRTGPGPTGVGELMVPLPAPAVANAVCNLEKGRRLCRVPLTMDEDCR